MSLSLYIQRPFANKHENRQFEELLAVLQNQFGSSEAEYVSVLVNFSMAKGQARGQFDAVVIRRHMVMILELKDAVAKVSGKDTNEPWTLDFGKGRSQSRDLFRQIWGQHNALLTYLIQDFTRARPGHQDDHYYVDARIVFREGSLFDITITNPIVSKWFDVITFDQVSHQVATAGKAEFCITPKDIHFIAKDLGLHRADPESYFLPFQSVEEATKQTLSVLLKRSPLPSTLATVQRRIGDIIGTEILAELMDLSAALRKLRAAPDWNDIKATTQHFANLKDEVRQRQTGKYRPCAEEVRWRELSRGLISEKGEEFLDPLDGDIERLLVDGIGALLYIHSLVYYREMLKIRQDQGTDNRTSEDILPEDQGRVVQLELTLALQRYRRYMADRVAECVKTTRSLAKQAKLSRYISVLLDLQPLSDSLPGDV